MGKQKPYNKSKALYIKMSLPLFSKISRGRKFITKERIIKNIESRGISLDDQRIKNTIDKLIENDPIDLKSFSTALKENKLVKRILNNELVIPEWDDFENEIKNIFDKCKDINEGKKSEATPRISRADDDHFAISICTIDGQRLNLGDTKVHFSSQSCSNVISYLLAVQHQGSEFVHQVVGKESCGKSNRNLNLKEVEISENKFKYVPHNPFSDAGAILCTSLIDRKASESERFRNIKKVIEQATASDKISFSHESFLYERNSSDRRACMAFMMRECKSFPEETNINQMLELYFQLLSLEITSQEMAVLAATLANGGVCPLNRIPVFRIRDVRDCLSLMLSCGLYDYSGEWAFKIGLPAKSSVSGCIFIAIPNRMGICIYSPRLDVNGNSVRAIRFAELMVEKFSFHQLESNREFGESIKIQPCQPSIALPAKGNTIPRNESSGNLSSLMSAAQSGDVDIIHDLVTESVDLMQKNYDKRTALHLAAARNHVEMCRLLINSEGGTKRGWMELSQRDRWGLTPLDVAYKNNALEVIKILEECGAKRGDDFKDVNGDK